MRLIESDKVIEFRIKKRNPNKPEIELIAGEELELKLSVNSPGNGNGPAEMLPNFCITIISKDCKRDEPGGYCISPLVLFNVGSC